MTYGRRFADDRFGFLVSASGSRREFGSDDIEPEYDLGDPGLGDDALEGLDTRHYTLWRARLGATAALDWRVGEFSNISLTGIYSELQDDENRRRVVHAIEDGEISFGHKNRFEAMKLFNLALAGDHLLPGGVGVDYDLTFSRSSEREDYDWEAEFIQGDVTFDPDISDPDNIQTNPTDGAVTDGVYEFDNILTGGDNTRNRDLTGAAAVTVPYRLGSQANGRLKFGAKIRDKDKDQDVTEIDNELVDDAGRHRARDRHRRAVRLRQRLQSRQLSVPPQRHQQRRRAGVTRPVRRLARRRGEPRGPDQRLRSRRAGHARCSP